MFSSSLINDATLCSGIVSYTYNANFSKGSLDYINLKYNESDVLPVNNSLCNYTYMLNNTAGAEVQYNATTNNTGTGTSTISINGTLVNSTNKFTVNVANGVIIYYNVTVDWLNSDLLAEYSENYTLTWNGVFT